MAKSSIKQIQFDEKKVISALQKNAREGIDEISKTCGFSRQKVWRLMNRLEKNQTIWGYHAVTDLEKLDINEYIILIKKTTKPVEKLVDKIISRELEKKAEKMGITMYNSFYLHGYYDWIICFTAKDLKQAKRFTELINVVYPEYIKSTILLENIFPVKRNIRRIEMSFSK